MNAPAVVRVRGRIVVSDSVTLELDREHGHFQIAIGRWFVETDGFGNLVVRGNTAGSTILKVPA